MFEIELRHNFETAHRLSTPGSPQKCKSIHGHSWWATVTIAGPRIDEHGILVEFGAFKKAWRSWLDSNLDHHLVLSTNDPLLPVLRGFEEELRIYETEGNPTTEVLAKLVFEAAVQVLAEIGVSEEVVVKRVHLQETRVNAAVYQAPERCD